MRHAMEQIESPCRRICVLDSVTDLCIGCGRTRAEIAAWRGLSPEERRSVMTLLADRLRGMTSRAVRGGRVSRRAGGRD
jgi:predicted Fe-S protein YdhL (DUF1289 family)